MPDTIVTRVADSSARSVLMVEHLSMRFGGLVAIDDLSFDVQPGSITSLIGPNGAGKTTVFNCITGFYRADAGRISLRERSGRTIQLEGRPGHFIARRAGVVRTFQNIRLFSGMTVLENLMVAQHNALSRSARSGAFGLIRLPGYAHAEREALKKAKAWLERIDLVHRADDPAGALSYGAQRRLEIARAMCTDPVLLCLDEPAAGLNPRESLELKNLLLAIRQAHDVSIVLVEHDMSVVMDISDHVIVLDRGRKIASGTPEEIRSDDLVIAAYLGVVPEAAGMAT